MAALVGLAALAMVRSCICNNFLRQQHQTFDCGSICLQDKAASSFQQIKFLNDGI
jgi:hypothetical protein